MSQQPMTPEEVAARLREVRKKPRPNHESNNNRTEYFHNLSKWHEARG